MTYKTGGNYTGQWKDGVYNGFGHIWFKSRIWEWAYRGSLRDGVPCGTGEFRYNYVDIFKNTQLRRINGLWVSGKLTLSDDNRGVIIYPDRNVYISNEYDAHERLYDIYFYNNGDIYQGSFAINFRHGNGHYAYANGCVYKGEFKYDKPHGEGEFTYTYTSRLTKKRKTRTVSGKWNNGFLDLSGITVIIYEKTGDAYIGDADNARKNGTGIYIYHNGDIYQGSFLNDVRHGLGHYTYANGDVYEGIYEFDIPTSKMDTSE